MKTKIGVIFCIILILQGCIPSLYPLYTKETLMSVDGVLGEWNLSKEKEIWVFENYSDLMENPVFEPFELPDRDKTYYLTIKSNFHEHGFLVHFINLGDQIYADFFPLQADGDVSSFFGAHLVSAHSFAKVRFENGQLVLGMMDQGELEKAITEKRVRIKHERTSQGIVLTASTRDLQSFISKYGSLDESFDSESIFEKADANTE